MAQEAPCNKVPGYANWPPRAETSSNHESKRGPSCESTPTQGGCGEDELCNDITCCSTVVGCNLLLATLGVGLIKIVSAKAAKAILASNH